MILATSNIQFGEVAPELVRENLKKIMTEQKARLSVKRDHVQRFAFS